MMSGIRSRDTKPELLIRKGLFALGFRYRLHAADVPGKPDLVLPKHRAVIFVNGCFWHGHDCHLFKAPSTRPEFWKKKIARNVERDREVRLALTEKGWRSMVIWECALKGRMRLDLSEVMERATAWLLGNEAAGEIRGLA